MQPYWTFCNDLAMIDRIVLKCKRIVIPTTPKHQALEWQHNNHMELEKNVSTIM